MKLPELPPEEAKRQSPQTTQPVAPEPRTSQPPEADRKPSLFRRKSAASPADGEQAPPTPPFRSVGPVRSSGQGIARRPASLLDKKSAPPPVEKNRPPLRRRAPSAAPADPAAASGLQAAAQPEGPLRVVDQEQPKRSVPSGKGINPGLKLRALEAAGRNASPPETPREKRLRLGWKGTLRAASNVTAIPSLIVNAVLVGVLLVMAFQLRKLNSIVNHTLGGLYNSFVQMDNASIETTITVNADIPLNFSLPVQQNTDVTLTRNVSIPGAYILLNGESVPVNVTLPAGTNLPIALNLGIPVQLTVPVTLQVPVNIPMNQTQLDTPFKGLQDTILPLYCALNKNAQYPEGVFVCK